MEDLQQKLIYNMEFANIFPTTIAKDTIPLDLNNYIPYIKSLEYVKNGGNGSFSKNQQVLDLKIFEKLKDFILSKSKIYLDCMSHIYQDIQIASSWVNIINKEEDIHLHWHDNSYISGVYYLTTGSNLHFRRAPLKTTFIPEDIIPTNNPSTWKEFTITPSPNDLILFPSTLEHYITTSESNTPRISLAFNVIPKGEFGGNTWKLFL